MIKKLRAFLSDSLLSILGLVFMNIAAQMAVYPFLERVMGESAFGDCLHWISYINIIAVSVGCAANHARMVASINGPTYNGDYHIILMITSGLISVVCFAMWEFHLIPMTFSELVTYILLFCLTLWRYYADVEYRLSVNYKKCLIYYGVIGIGYFIGLLGYQIFPVWPLPLLIGEVFGVAYVFVFGRILRCGFWQCSASVKKSLSRMITLIPALLLSNLIFNADRLVLSFFASGTAVTLYYTASLLGKTMSLITTPLHGVVIGYLARFKDAVTKKMIFGIVGCMVGLSAGASVATVIASHIFIRILYPDIYPIASKFFVVANLSAVFYFASGIMTVVLLRIASEKYQLVINIVYAAAFLFICIPGTVYGNLTGFSWTFLLVNFLRFVLACVIGFFAVSQKNLLNNRERK